MEDISFIIPAYNAEKTLNRCLDSILTLGLDINYKIIVVDDGSSDSTFEICSSYEKKYSEVQVIRKKNGGVSSARNIGLDASNSKWVVFVDSDDWVLSGFNYIAHYCLTSNADVVFYDYITENGYVATVDERNIGVRVIKSRELSLETVIKSTLDYEKPQGIFTRFNSPWSKVFRRNAIGDDKRFDERISVAEDFIFNLAVYSAAKKFEYIDVPGYAYYVNMNSVTRTRRSNIIENNIIVGQEFAKIKKSFDKYQWFENAYYYSVLKGFLNVVFLKYVNGSASLLNREEKKELLKIKMEEPYNLAFKYYPDVADKFNRKHRLILNSLYYNNTLVVQGLIIYNKVEKNRKLHLTSSN